MKIFIQLPVMLCVLIAFNSMAAPLTTIYDSGNTLPIDSYKNRDAEEPEEQPQALFDQDTAFIPEFPLTTPSMTPDIIRPQSLSIPYLQVPLFIIGNDSLSKQWLVTRRDELIQIGAVGMLIEATSLDEVSAIQRLGDGLHIYPASGHDVARQLGIAHYPVLISRQGIEQ